MKKYYHFCNSYRNILYRNLINRGYFKSIKIMDFISSLPDNINVTVSKKDLLELFNICLIKSRQDQEKHFPVFLSIKQLSEYFNYSEPAVYKMVAQAEIPCYKISGKLLFKKTEIDAWLFEFRQPTVNEKVGELLRKEAYNGKK
mgnify:CR=1 FL=1